MDLELSLDGQLRKSDIIDILRINEKIGHIQDVPSLLDRVLSEARTITNADAGSIYLVKGNRLSIEYVQNDTLMNGGGDGNKYLYARQELDIDNHSIAGYAALNKGSLLIDDVYRLPPGVPYTFNRTFDEASSYHTQSVLTVPLISRRDRLIGVMQIINARDGGGRVVPFPGDFKPLVELFADQAAVAIERAQLTREIILRMIRMAELRDPSETAAHVNRVATISVEIYQRWARKKGFSTEEIRRVKEVLGIASMLHDVGKVAISDVILKKAACLSEGERNIMKLHTLYGHRLFMHSNSDWDDMAAEIALNHHEKWDGSGYPGKMDEVPTGPVMELPPGRGKKGEEIPFSARVVALADVYDALISRRFYKKAWSEEAVLDHIREERGKHFDPEMVDAFFEIYDVIKAIREKFPAPVTEVHC